MTMLKIFDTKTEKLKYVISTASSVFVDINKKFMVVTFSTKIVRIDFDAVDIISTAYIPLYHVYTAKSICS